MILHVPAYIYAKTSAEWEENLSEYPASSYSLHFNFRNASSDFQITATADGDIHSIVLTATSTTNWTAGTYQYVAYVQNLTDATERHFIGRGIIEIRADPTADSALDYRSHYEKMVTALKAVLEGRAAKDYDAITIAGRSITMMSLKELRESYAYYNRLYQAELRQEKINNGEKPGNRFLFQFSRS
jgi:hypothetical protein